MDFGIRDSLKPSSMLLPPEAEFESPRPPSVNFQRALESLVEAHQLEIRDLEQKVSTCIKTDDGKEFIDSSLERQFSPERQNSNGSVQSHSHDSVWSQRQPERQVSSASACSQGGSETKPKVRLSYIQERRARRSSVQERQVSADSAGSKGSNISSQEVRGRGHLSTVIRAQKRLSVLAQQIPRLRRLKRSDFHCTIAEVLEHPCYALLSSLVIIANSIALGVTVEFFSRSDQAAPLALEALDVLCNLFFMVDIVMRLIAYRMSFFGGRELGWNLFDLGFVIMYAVEVPLRLAGAETGTDEIFGVFKTLKICRIARVFKIIHFVHEIAHLAMMVFASVQPFGAAVALMWLLTYLFAVAISSNVSGWIEENQDTGHNHFDVIQYNFGSMSKTLYTLILSVTGGITWNSVVDPLFEISTVGPYMFMVYVFFVLLAVLNIFTGVFVEKAIESTHQEHLEIERELKAKEEYSRKLILFFEAMDEDGSGSVSIDELKSMTQDPVMVARFNLLGFDIRNAEQLVELLDADETGELNQEEFIEGCMLFKGTARSLEIQAVLSLCNQILEAVLAQSERES